MTIVTILLSYHGITVCASTWTFLFRCSFLVISLLHDDVIKWKYFPCYWPFVRGIYRSSVNSLQKPVTQSFSVFFDLLLNKRLSKQTWDCWFETPWHSFWRQCNGYRALYPHVFLVDFTSSLLPLNTWRNDNVVITPKRRHFVVITSKWRHFGVITTSLLRNAFAG